MQKELENKQRVGEMRKRRETMADGKRYMIYYTFGETQQDAPAEREKSEAKENV